VLLADTDLGTSLVLSVALQRDCRVETATTGPHVGVCLRDCPPDLMVLEPSLPGLERAPLPKLPAHPTCRIILVMSRNVAPLHLHPWMRAVIDVLYRPLSLGELLSHIATVLPIRSAGRLPSPVIRALEYLRSHYAERLSVAHMAELSEVSPNHLARLFSDSMGVPTKEYVSAVRVGLLKHLLRESDVKLAGLAHRLGFTDAAHLSHVFRRHAGEWPGAYRRSRRRALP
jgi:AraC-like DNA-binding protein